MALIEILHVVADMYPVDPDFTDEIVEGTLLTLDSSGNAAICTRNKRCIGIAGDSQSNTGVNTGNPSSDTHPNTPYSASLIINGSGATRVTSNRVSDFYNETLASGKITVYHSGGVFATDLFESTVSSSVTGVPAAALYSSDNGYLTTTANSTSPIQVVATMTAAVTAWESGVPGVDVNGSMSLGLYVTIKLEV